MEQEDNVLNELKEQLSALQAKLDRQTEINDKAIRMAIDKSADKMHSLGMSGVLICIIGLILVETIVILQGVSIPFAIATAVFMGGNAITAIFFKYRLMDIDPGQSMVETASQMVKYKKFNRRSVVMGLPIAIAWAGWYCFEMIRILGSVRAPVVEMAADKAHETVMVYGPDLVDSLRRKIAVMEAHRRDFLRLYRSRNR